MLLTAIVLILPVFLPSYAHPQHFYQDIIGTLTLLMNILSFGGPPQMLARDR